MKLWLILLYTTVYSCNDSRELGVSKVLYIRHTPILLRTGEHFKYADTIVGYFKDKDYVIAIPSYADDPGTSTKGDIDLGPTKTIIYRYLVGKIGEPKGFYIDTLNIKNKRKELSSDSIIRSLGIGSLDLSKIDSMAVLKDSIWAKDRKEVKYKYLLKNPNFADGDTIELLLNKSHPNPIITISKQFDSEHSPYKLVRFQLKYNAVFSTATNKMLPKRELKLEVIESAISHTDKEALTFFPVK